MEGKRERVTQFRDRLRQLVARHDGNLARLARRTGLDRSALSQFLNEGSTRLPRAETLCAIAASEQVSVDWLLGLSQSEREIGEVKPIFDIETPPDGKTEALIAAWHREAIGFKIRYVPADLPDLLRTDAVTEYVNSGEARALITAKTDQATYLRDYSRRPETDMEVVMPRQRLQAFAAGHGIWAGLDVGTRRSQLSYMVDLLEEFYPTVRLFLYDDLIAYSAPYTVFGPKRAAIYLGDMYLVIYSVDHIRQLIKRFDHLIRIAEVGPDRVHRFVKDLRAY